MPNFLFFPKEITSSTSSIGGAWWHSWLRHCATSQKVAGSIPDGVIDWLNPVIDSVSNRNEYQGYLLEVNVASA
jgi:hypothetical protein